MSVIGGFGGRDAWDHLGKSEDVTMANGANAATVVDMDKEVSNLTVAAGENATITIAAPSGMVAGQVKRFVAANVNATGTIAISGVVSGVGAAEVHTLNADAEYLDVMYTGARFVRLASTATIT